MTDVTDQTQATRAAMAAGALLLLAGATFLVGALLHAGVVLPLGVATLSEPRIVPATIVEGVCALALSVGAYGLLTRRSWGSRAARAAGVLGVRAGEDSRTAAMSEGPLGLSAARAGRSDRGAGR